MLQLAEAVAAAAGVRRQDFSPEFGPVRPGEVRHSCLDVKRARSELDLGSPTPLVDGLRRTLDRMRTQ